MSTKPDFVFAHNSVVAEEEASSSVPSWKRAGYSVTAECYHAEETALLPHTHDKTAEELNEKAVGSLMVAEKLRIAAEGPWLMAVGDIENIDTVVTK